FSRLYLSNCARASSSSTTSTSGLVMGGASFAGGFSVGARTLGRDLLAGDEIVDVFGDVGGVIADALDILGDEQQMRAGGDRARVFHHVGEQFAEQRVVVRVDVVVVEPDADRGLHVAVRVRVERLLQLPGGDATHAIDALDQPDRLGFVEDQRALGD